MTVILIVVLERADLMSSNTHTHTEHGLQHLFEFREVFGSKPNFKSKVKVAST